MELLMIAAAEDLGKPMTNKWVGSFLRGKLRLSTQKSHGVYVVSATERTKIANLASRYGVANEKAADA
jgi:hypothetical protein